MIYMIYSEESFSRPISTAPIGRLEMVENTLQVRPKGAFEWYSGSNLVGKTVHEFDYLFTGENSRAEIKLDNGDRFNLESQSLVHLKRSVDGDLELIVFEGNLQFQSKGSSKEIRVSKHRKISLPNSHGADSEIAPQDLAKAEANVADLPVVGIADSPLLQLVQSTNDFPASSGVSSDSHEEQWNPVADIKANYIMTTPKERFLGTPSQIAVQWSSRTQAQKYRVDVFAKANLSQTVFSQTTVQSSITFNWGRSGQYIVKVSEFSVGDGRLPSSISERDSQKLLAIPAIQLASALKTTFPRPNQLILLNQDNPDLRFNWSRESLYSLYVLQISKDETFNQFDFQEFIESDVSPLDVKIKSLQSGNWYWRVKGLSRASDSDWSSVQKFKLHVSKAPK